MWLQLASLLASVSGVREVLMFTYCYVFSPCYFVSFPDVVTFTDMSNWFGWNQKGTTQYHVFIRVDHHHRHHPE